MARCNAIAREWLPKGDYSTPTVYFIYDGNGSAFAREGAVCFDLYGAVFGMRPEATRFTNLSEISVDEMERVLAHEFHHIYRAQRFGPTSHSSNTWQEKMIDRVTAGLISEGIAQQCNPPEGFKAELWNDTAVIAFWIKELGEKLTVSESWKRQP